MSPVTQPTRAEMYAQSSGKAPLILITATHPTDTTNFPMRITSDSVNTVSNGETFLPTPFQIELPPETKQGDPRVRITLDAPTIDFVGIFRDLETPPTVKIEMVIGDSEGPGISDTIERVWDDLLLKNVEASDLKLTFDLGYEDFESTPFPRDRYDLAKFPGLY